MLITAKDIKKLEELDLNIFSFDYSQHNIYDKELHQNLVNFLRDKKISKFRAEYINDDLYEDEFQEEDEDDYEECDQERLFPDVLDKLAVNEVYSIELYLYSQRYKYQKEFLNTLIGQDLKKLEAIFKNYNISGKPKYFINKGLFAVDKYTRQYKNFLLGGYPNNNYSIYQLTQTVDLVSLYNFHDHIFKEYDTEKLYRKYNTRKNKILNANADNNMKANFLIASLKGVISFKRPLEELNALLDNYIDILMHPDITNFIKNLDYKAFPNIVEQLNIYVSKSEKFHEPDVQVRQEVLDYKIVSVEVEKLALKHGYDNYDCHDKLNKKVNALVKKLSMSCELIEGPVGQWTALLKGESGNIQFAIDFIFKVINDKELFDKSIKSFEQYCAIAIEKELIHKTLAPKEKDNKKFKHKL